MPGAHGLRTWRTCHGPTRARVALRVVGVSESAQRGQGEAGSNPSVTSRLSPQKGQTYPSAALPDESVVDGGNDVGVRGEVTGSVARVMSVATSHPSSTYAVPRQHHPWRLDQHVAR